MYALRYGSMLLRSAPCPHPFVYTVCGKCVPEVIRPWAVAGHKLEMAVSPAFVERFPYPACRVGSAAKPLAGEQVLALGNSFFKKG